MNSDFRFVFLDGVGLRLDEIVAYRALVGRGREPRRRDRVETWLKRWRGLVGSLRYATPSWSGAAGARLAFARNCPPYGWPTEHARRPLCRQGLVCPWCWGRQLVPAQLAWAGGRRVPRLALQRRGLLLSATDRRPEEAWREAFAWADLLRRDWQKRRRVRGGSWCLRLLQAGQSERARRRRECLPAYRFEARFLLAVGRRFRPHPDESNLLLFRRRQRPAAVTRFARYPGRLLLSDRGVLAATLDARPTRQRLSGRWGVARLPAGPDMLDDMIVETSPQSDTDTDVDFLPEE